MAPAGLALLALLACCLGPAAANYVWDGAEWKWQDEVAAGEDEEGSGGAGGSYHHDDEDDLEGSAEDPPTYGGGEEDTGRMGGAGSRSRDRGEINVDADEEIDPHEVDIGFHDEPTAPPSPAPTSARTPLPPTEPPTEEPHIHKQASGGETNFFAQPGILAAVVGGTVVGLLCTILLVMLIVYRMRKADEGSYSLNEPKRSPNVHSYLKAPTREFFA